MEIAFIHGITYQKTKSIIVIYPFFFFFFFFSTNIGFFVTIEEKRNQKEKRLKTQPANIVYKTQLPYPTVNKRASA
jgi:hypothetical protein